MAATLNANGYSDVELIRGAGGIFEVEADGRMIFSKADIGRFPQDQEVLDGLK